MQSEWLRTEAVDWAQMLRIADAGFLYAILDACDSPPVQAKVQEMGEQATSLLQGTMREGYVAHAPYLAKADPAVLDWIRGTLGVVPWGIFVLAKAGMSELHAHLQQFLVVQLPDGEKWFFRYYDPRIFSVYLPSCTRQEAGQFFGPVRGYAVCDGEGLKVLQAPPAGETTPIVPPWRIRAQQYQLFAAASLRNFEVRAAAHLCEFFPEQARSLGADGLNRAIAYGVQRAQEYGICAERDVCQYLDLMFGLGPDFDRDPKLPWAGRILRKESEEPPERLTQLFAHLEQTTKEGEQHGTA